MSIERTKMIKSLQKDFVPELRKLKFKGSFPHFRRTIEGKTSLLSFQFDRYGGGFVINLSKWDKPEYKTHWGKTIQLNKLTAFDLDPQNRKRIYPKDTKEKYGKDRWFRYDISKLLSFGNKYDSLTNKVVEQISEMNKYWDEDSIV